MPFLWMAFVLFGRATGMEPLAILNSAVQPVWQAGVPMKVNIDYDVPAFGSLDELEELRLASAAEYEVAEKSSLSRKARAQHDGGLALRGSIVRSPRDMSFLAAKTIPVDAYKIRNSLYLTQFMRTPAQASVNVIAREDLPRMREEAKYRGMEDQLDRLRKTIEDDLAQIAT